MSEFTDLLLASTSPVVALCLIILGLADVAVFGYVRRRFNRMEDRLDDRIGRMEETLIQDALVTDGGRVEEDDDV